MNDQTPRVQSIPQSVDNSLNNSASFKLGQPWSGEIDERFRPTSVALAWTPEFLLVEATLKDDEIFTSATSDNEQLWTLGDVFEIFLMVEGRPDYAEMHIAPNAKRMHLNLPGVGGKTSPEASPLPFEKMLVWPPGFHATVVSTNDGWKLRAEIPAKALGLDSFHSQQRFRISFCRYDAARDLSPVLSTTASHPVIAFHRPDEWTQIILK